MVIGAGCSQLIVELLDHGYDSIIAVDISSAALDRLAEALGERADAVQRMVSDVCDLVLDEQVAVWHDRATFHFLTDPAQQARYAVRAAEAIAGEGHLVLSGFAPDGPLQCSGLDVARHSLDDLVELFGNRFELIESFEREHLTPWSASQRFLHTVFRRKLTDDNP